MHPRRARIGESAAAPVDLGSPGDVADAGSYVILAKTGITNVTGSMITGGNLGVSRSSGSAG